MRARRVVRLAAVTSAGALITALGGGPARAGGEPPEDGLIVADDLSGDWEEGPPEDDDDLATDEAAADIEVCRDFRKITRPINGVPKADGSTFTLDGQEIGSGVGVAGKKRAKRAVSTYASDETADCVEQLIAANPVTADFDIEVESGKGPDLGDGSALLAAELTGEDENTGDAISSSFQTVVVRVGGALAVYVYASRDSGANEDEFDDAVEAAAERLEEAA